MKGYNNIELIFKQQASLGWGPVFSDSICLTSLVEDSFFLKDIKLNVYDTSLNMSTTQLNKTLIQFNKLQYDFSSSFIMIPDFSFLDNKQKAITLNNKSFDLSKDLLLFKPYHHLTTNLTQIFEYNIFNVYSEIVLKQPSKLVTASDFLIIDFASILPRISKSLNQPLFLQKNITTSLLESDWKVIPTLNSYDKDCFMVNDLSKNDIQSHLYRNNYTREHIDLKFFLKIPLLESHIPDDYFKPDWSFGEYVPTMADYLKTSWEEAGMLFGVGDNNLAYRELLDRSSFVKDIEQAWGFVDIHDAFTSTENTGTFFRTEFYDTLKNEKITRLNLKKSWTDFNIDITAKDIEQKNFVINDAGGDPKYFRSMFLKTEYDVTMLNTIKNYPLIEELYYTRNSTFAEYDPEFIFDLEHRFDYEGLE